MAKKSKKKAAKKKSTKKDKKSRKDNLAAKKKAAKKKAGKKKRVEAKKLAKKKARKKLKAKKQARKAASKKKSAPSKAAAQVVKPTQAPAKSVKAQPARKKVSVRQRKIDDLFAYREIPWLISQTNIRAKAGFLRKLKSLQGRIYDLDHYLETAWTINKTRQTRYWNAMYKSMATFGLTRKEADALLGQIKRYEGHELSLREGKSPARLNIKHFYFYKSCDVKLARALIYREDPALEKIIRKTDWTDFDLITEVNDDIADVFEDLKIINANRFLFCLTDIGKIKTGSQYRAFIREIQGSNRKRFSKTSEAGKFVSSKTAAAVRQTNELLRDQLAKVDLAKIAGADVVMQTQAVES